MHIYIYTHLINIIQYYIYIYIDIHMIYIIYIDIQCMYNIYIYICMINVVGISRWARCKHMNTHTHPVHEEKVGKRMAKIPFCPNWKTCGSGNWVLFDSCSVLQKRLVVWHFFRSDSVMPSVRKGWPVMSWLCPRVGHPEKIKPPISSRINCWVPHSWAILGGGIRHL